MPQNNEQPTNKSAVVSLVVSLATFFVLWLIPVVGMAGSIVGVVNGHKALEQIKAAKQSGTGIAKTGLVLGYVSLVYSFLWTAFWNYWWLVFLSEVKM